MHEFFAIDWEKLQNLGHFRYANTITLSTFI